MSINNTPINKLIELYNLITDDTNDFNEMLSAYGNNEEQLREDIINNITDELLDNYNYDGDFNDDINAFDPCILLILKFFTMHISFFALNIDGILFSFTLFSWRNTLINTSSIIYQTKMNKFILF